MTTLVATSEIDHVRVLVVDDDRVLRTLAVEILIDDGIATIGVEEAGAAIIQLASLPSVDLLITDVNMPGMNGMDLAAHVQDRFPNIKILVVSGCKELDHDFSVTGAHFLQKPFSARQFLTYVRYLLSE